MAMPSEIPPAPKPRGRSKPWPQQAAVIHPVRLSPGCAARLTRVVVYHADYRSITREEAREEVLTAFVEAGLDMLEERLNRQDPVVWGRIAVKAFNAACGADPGLSWRDHPAEHNSNPEPIPPQRFLRMQRRIK